MQSNSTTPITDAIQAAIDALAWYADDSLLLALDVDAVRELERKAAAYDSLTSPEDMALILRKARALDAAADARICDGIGEIDMDDWTFEHMTGTTGDDEQEWRMLWRTAFLEALEAAAEVK